MTVDELEELLAGATPGPWVSDEPGGSDAWIHDAQGFHVACVYDRASDGSGEPQFDEACAANLALIAALRNAAPGLIEENRRMREALCKVKGYTGDPDALQIIDEALSRA